MKFVYLTNNLGYFLMCSFGSIVVGQCW